MAHSWRLYNELLKENGVNSHVMAKSIGERNGEQSPLIASITTLSQDKVPFQRQIRPGQ